jgi:hypothetical protein
MLNLFLEFAFGILVIVNLMTGSLDRGLLCLIIALQYHQIRKEMEE